MEGLNCKFCRRVSLQFTILKCDHVVCAECLWGQLKSSLTGTSSILCPCGIVSNFTSKSIMPSPAATAHISSNASPRRTSSAKKPVRTETMSMSRKRQATPERSFRRSLAPKAPKNDELSRELDFMRIQYNKSMQEVERNFRKVVETINKRYENLVANIKLFWLEQIVQAQPLQVLNVSKLLERKYHKAVGHKLRLLNDNLLENLANYRMSTLQCETIKAPLFKEEKENISRVQNCRAQRQKLLRCIDQLKEESKGLKKVGKKTSKMRFL